jgi:hypothetical protein
MDKKNVQIGLVENVLTEKKMPYELEKLWSCVKPYFFILVLLFFRFFWRNVLELFYIGT